MAAIKTGHVLLQPGLEIAKPALIVSSGQPFNISRFAPVSEATPHRVGVGVGAAAGGTSKHFKYGLCTFQTERERGERVWELECKCLSVTLAQNHSDIANLFCHPTAHSESEELPLLASFIMCSGLGLCFFIFSACPALQCFLGATLKVAGCQDSHAFASFSLLTANFLSFQAPATASELQLEFDLELLAEIEVVNSPLSRSVCQLRLPLLRAAKLKLLP